MKRKRHFFLRALLLVLILGALVADSNLRPVKTEYTLSFADLPEAFSGLRIAQLSDLHGAKYGEGNARLLRLVRAAAPDLIALTGDLADGDTDLAVLETLLSELAAIAPVYYVSGNHEWSDGVLPALRPMLARQGVRYLQNEYVYLERGGARIVLAGVEDPNGWADQPKPDAVAAALPEGEFRVLLAHRNNFPAEYPALDVDLILCGHAHGGIVRLPFLGGLLGHGRELLPAYAAGVFTTKRYTMVVSRGLGNSGGALRFLNNPELVVAELIKTR